jgi:hypothetical protein
MGVVMKKILFMLIMFISCSAWADWVKLRDANDKEIAKGDSGAFYYDPSSIKKDGNIRRVWQMESMRFDSFTFPNAVKTFSVRVLKEYDCVQKLDRFLEMYSYETLMAKGEGSPFPFPQGWVKVKLGSTEEMVMKIVCAR